MENYLKEALQLNEMAYTRVDAMIKCYSLGKNFIEHFHKIYCESDSDAVNHWCNEMQSWFNSVKDITLKPKNKHLNGTQMRDWFYTYGSDPTEFLTDEDENEAYEEFIDELEKTGDVKHAIVEVLR